MKLFQIVPTGDFIHYVTKKRLLTCNKGCEEYLQRGNLSKSKIKGEVLLETAFPMGRQAKAYSVFINVQHSIVRQASHLQIFPKCERTFLLSATSERCLALYGVFVQVNLSKQ